MVLSRRERNIGIITVAAAALLSFDYFLLTPYLGRMEKAAEGRKEATTQLAAAAELFRHQRKLRNIWAELEEGGLSVDASQAESQAHHAVTNWATGAGVSLPVLKPERQSEEGKFQVISFDVTGPGSMPAISRLLWALETSKVPIRVNEVQITPKREGTDDLSVRLSVSALCMPPSPADAAKSSARQAGAKGGRS